jgi:hypothetical protein
VQQDLLTSQKDDVYRVVEEAGFDPREFEWEVEQLAVGTVPVLRHTAGFFFQFMVNDRSGHFGYGSPGEQTQSEFFETRYGGWEEVLPLVALWLSYLRREIRAPDLWRELERERELVTSPPSTTENTPFTPAEQAQIARQLEEIKGYVRQTHQLTVAQYEAIDVRLDYLTEAATRIGRIDWRTMLLGAFLSLLLAVIVPPEPVRELLVLTLRALAPLFGGGPPELPGGGGPPLSLP